MRSPRDERLTMAIDYKITDSRPDVQARIALGADHRERKYEIVRMYAPHLERRPRTSHRDQRR